MMVSFNLLPSLTLPTHISENSATIIDNVFCNSGYYGSYDTGIIITDISDHFPYFYSFNNNQSRNKFQKILQYRDFKKQNVDKMIQELESIDIIQLLNPDLWSDPNTNYNILENLLSSILNKHIPIRRVKLNKYKHKKTDWITNGILKSIKFRDNLYNRMKQINQDSVEYIHIKINLATYNRILTFSIRLSYLCPILSQSDCSVICLKQNVTPKYYIQNKSTFLFVFKYKI